MFNPNQFNFQNQRNQFNAPNINQEQFKSFLNNLKPSAIDELEKIARQKGISPQEIEQGKQFVLNLMK